MTCGLIRVKVNFKYAYKKGFMMADVEDTPNDVVVTVNHPDGSVSEMRHTEVTKPDGTVIPEGFGITTTDHNEVDDEGNPKISVHVGPVHSDAIPGPMPIHLTPEEVIASEVVEPSAGEN